MVPGLALAGVMSDIITAIVDLLRAAPGIAALVAGRVYGDELPESLMVEMPTQCVVVKPSGGAAFQGAGKLNAEAQRFDLFCYGASPFEADQLRRACRPVVLGIERRQHNGVLIHWVQSAGGYLTGRDRDGAWPYAFASFQTLYSEEAAP